jgi:hypothetical protein
MTARERLSGAQLAIMRSLFVRGGHGVPITLSFRLRHAVPELWRRELIQIWHRLAPGRGSEGPYYSLTLGGQQFADAIFAVRFAAGQPEPQFNRAPRRFSGAEQAS